MKTLWMCLKNLIPGRPYDAFSNSLQFFHEIQNMKSSVANRLLENKMPYICVCTHKHTVEYYLVLLKEENLIIWNKMNEYEEHFVKLKQE